MKRWPSRGLKGAGEGRDLLRRSRVSSAPLQPADTTVCGRAVFLTKWPRRGSDNVPRNPPSQERSSPQAPCFSPRPRALSRALRTFSSVLTLRGARLRRLRCFMLSAARSNKECRKAGTASRSNDSLGFKRRLGEVQQQTVLPTHGLQLGANDGKVIRVPPRLLQKYALRTPISGPERGPIRTDRTV